MTRSRILLVLGLVCSAVFLWLAVRSIDVGQLAETLGRARLLWAFPFLIALAAFCWMKAARWVVLLEPVAPSSTAQLLPPVVIGYAATTLMPMQLGEVVRAYFAARLLRIRVASALASIALERVLDVFALLVMLGTVLLLGTNVGDGLKQAGLWMLLAGFIALGMLAAYAAFPARLNGWIDRLSGWLPPAARLKLLEQLGAMAQGLAILTKPSKYLRVVVASALQWACMFGCAWISLLAFGLDLPVSAPLLILATTLLGMSLPSGPGYVGTIQLAFWVALAPFGISREDAIAASIFYHFLLCGPLLLWGAFYMVRARIGLKELRREAVLVAAPPG